MNTYFPRKLLIREWLLSMIIMIIMAIPGGLLAQLGNLEDVDAATKKGFFKTYFSDLFKDFKDSGDPFALTGGVGLNLRSYSISEGQVLRQDPFFYALNANLNVRIYKLNLPVSLLVTAKNTSSSFPSFRELIDAFRRDIEAKRDRFVRLGMSPHYKWIKLHLGHRTMSFSKFTLSNLVFYGAGVELTPGKWRVAAMSGRLAKAEPIDLSLATPNIPVYERFGWGTKIGYGDKDQFIDFILFKARDDVNSIFIDPLNTVQVAPEENMTLGINIQKRFFEHLRFRAEFGLSTISPNALDAEGGSGIFLPRFMYQERITTEEHMALDLSVDYEAEKFTAGVQFKRIDPNYRSFGAFFFNNDVVDLLGRVRFTMLKGAMNVGLSGGVQSNNLDLSKPSTTRRLIYAGDVSYTKKAFTASIDYSNNTTDVGYVLNPDLDSLNAVIVTQSSGMTLSYSIPDQSQNQHVFVLTTHLQNVGDDIDNPLQSNTSQMILGNFTYNYALSESKWRFSARANYNQNELSEMRINRLGFGLGVSKSLLGNKINVGLDVNFFNNSNEAGGSGTNLNSQLRGSYRISKSLNSSLQWNLLSINNDNSDPFTESIGNLGFQYNFNIRPAANNRKEAKTTESSPNNN